VRGILWLRDYERASIQDAENRDRAKKTLQLSSHKTPISRGERPLLALCNAGAPEEEEENSVYSYLSFFELGADGKMHEIKRRLLAEGDWDFVLPQKGKTILVRAPKSKKVLHKFTWNGEKFVKEK
jgi:hypothetical protein